MQAALSFTRLFAHSTLTLLHANERSWKFVRTANRFDRIVRDFNGSLFTLTYIMEFSNPSCYFYLFCIVIVNACNGFNETIEKALEEEIKRGERRRAEKERVCVVV